jgi:ABC-2 type transport system permease protein
MIVLLVLFDAAAVLLADNRGAALLVAVGSVGVVVSVAALALVLTAYNPFPTSRPGTNPWSDKAGFSGAAFVAAFASLLLGWIPSAPGGALLAFGYATDRTGLMLLGLAVSLAIPGALYWLSLRLSARRAEARMPEIYARVHHWVN